MLRNGLGRIQRAVGYRLDPIGQMLDVGAVVALEGHAVALLAHDQHGEQLIAACAGEWLNAELGAQLACWLGEQQGFAAGLAGEHAEGGFAAFGEGEGAHAQSPPNGPKLSKVGRMWRLSCAARRVT